MFASVRSVWLDGAVRSTTAAIAAALLNPLTDQLAPESTDTAVGAEGAGAKRCDITQILGTAE
jgi:hypothetical protein